MRLHRIYPVIKNHYQKCEIKNCTLIVDGKSFFKNAYKRSGCQYILGGEYDRYAEYLQKILNNFKKANIECFVVFSGGMAADFERRLEIHQKIINETDAITYINKDLHFSEPAFTKDVHREVLNEMGVKYTICEGENLSEMVNLAKTYRCAILTDYVECCLFQVPCIQNGSLKFNDDLGFFEAKLYEPQNVKSRSGTPYPYEKMAAFLVIMDENNDFLIALKDLLHVRPNIAGVTFRNWMFKQTTEQVFYHMSRRLSSKDYKQFEQDNRHMLQKLKTTKKTLAVKHFESALKMSALKEPQYYERALASGRLTTSYINLRNLNLFSGSWLIVDKDKEDAMMPAMEIVSFAHQVLTKFQGADITFVGREGTTSTIRTIKSNINYERPPKQVSYFEYFLTTALPGFSLKLLDDEEEDCKLLISGLVYHSMKVNENFAWGAYSILLSYVMLSKVAKVTGSLKSSNYTLEAKVASDGAIPASECFAAAKSLVKYFYVNGREKFDRSVLHSFAEFEHVLNQIDHLNQLCGELTGIMYHRTINATFIHNIYHLFTENEPMGVVKSLLSGCPNVFRFYEHIVGAYRKCVCAVRV